MARAAVTYITPMGWFNNMYARRLVRVVTGDDLFGRR